jgi:hypothetical protein
MGATFALTSMDSPMFVRGQKVVTPKRHGILYPFYCDGYGYRPGQFYRPDCLGY